MATTYKLLALDMDGTLLNDESHISEENRYWIGEARKAGITVCLSTGRGIFSIMPFAEQLELDGPIVAVNGSEVWEAPGRLLLRHSLPYEDIAALRELAIKHDAWYWAYSTDGVCNRDSWPDDPASLHWLKFGYYEERESVLASIKEEVERLNRYELTNSHPCNLELNPSGVSKAAGLREVCKLLGLEMNQVVAMGDSLNDAAMIREAGLGVAMGNAQDAVKAIADAVTLSNNEHGVAHVIRTHLLQRS